MEPKCYNAITYTADSEVFCRFLRSKLEKIELKQVSNGKVFSMLPMSEHDDLVFLNSYDEDSIKILSVLIFNNHKRLLRLLKKNMKNKKMDLN